MAASAGRIADVTQPEAQRPAGRFGLVLLLVLASYVLSASTAKGAVEGSVLFAMQAGILWLVLGETGSRKVQRLVGLLLLLVGIGLLVALAVGGPGDDTTLVSVVVNSLLYLVAPIAIVRRLATREYIDGQTLLATIATYVMIGMFFAYAFEMVALLQEGDFFGAAGDGTRSEYLFFSFTTLLTVGYGNLVPETNPGQTMAMMEAMTGQLFLIIAVARVVTLLGRPREPLRRQGPAGSST
jgi:Ion channel